MKTKIQYLVKFRGRGRDAVAIDFLQHLTLDPMYAPHLRRLKVVRRGPSDGTSIYWHMKRGHECNPVALLRECFGRRLTVYEISDTGMHSVRVEDIAVATFLEKQFQ